MAQIYVEDEYIDFIGFVGYAAEKYSGIIEAMKNDPILINVTNMLEIPVTGSHYDDGFAEDIEMEENNILPDTALFLFVSDNTVKGKLLLILSAHEHLVAAFESNPRFEVKEMNDDEIPMANL
jgi:hypothetical protein